MQAYGVAQPRPITKPLSLKVLGFKLGLHTAEIPVGCSALFEALRKKQVGLAQSRLNNTDARLKETTSLGTVMWHTVQSF